MKYAVAVLLCGLLLTCGRIKGTYDMSKFCFPEGHDLSQAFIADSVSVVLPLSQDIFSVLNVEDSSQAASAV